MATKAINNYSYDRNTIKAGILHFGVGNFHRDHLKFMTSRLLEDSLTAWMADLRCHDSAGRREHYEALKAQNGEYTLTVCGRDGNNEVYRLGALVELYWGYENKDAIFNKMPMLKIN